MKDIIQAILLFIALIIVATRSSADTIDQAFQFHFEDASDVEYIQYESVQYQAASDKTGIKYLVLDFKPVLALTAIQPTVHHICRTILKDIPLVTQLSYEGYGMISVSFDERHQYDCL
ncbi:MAG: hypothetical protein C9356_11200 [Oleiphilus sp.]|nr:MAG: hypothetical protein C9356_11200 [Oleiphilus sp.]